jgi:8-oxo-dGTP diphosphatase
MSEKYTTVILSNICIIEDKSGQILVQDRQREDWPGLTFPGGHVEKNETLEASVIREVKEETGLDIRNPLLCGIMEWPWDDGQSRYLALVYKCREYSGELKDSEEGHLFWIKKEDLNKYQLSTDTDKIFEIAESRSF